MNFYEQENAKAIKMIPTIIRVKKKTQKQKQKTPRSITFLGGSKFANEKESHAAAHARRT